MFVSNKLKSDELIRYLGVNYSPFEIVYDYKQAEKYITTIPEPIGIREKRRGGGQFIFGLSRLNALKILKDNIVPFPVGIYHDMHEAEKYLIYQGEIQLFDDYTISAVYCSIAGIKNREACRHKDKILVSNITWDCSAPLYEHNGWFKGWRYKPLQEIIDYLVHYEIIGPVVEFSYYSKKVGWKNEQIVIWEIRNY